MSTSLTVSGDNETLSVDKSGVVTSNMSPLLWDDPQETRNPKNWRLSRRIFHTAIPCLISFEVTFSTSVTTPAASIIASSFSVSRTESLLPLSLYTLGLAIGPLFLAPFSEVFGRRLLYISTLLFLLAFTAAAGAAPSFSALLICRFLAGFLGSAAMAIGAGTVADIWSLQKSGATVGIFFILGPFLGPILGPVAGTFILDGHQNDWRWTQWLVLILGAPIVLGALLMKETSKNHILRHENQKDVDASIARKTLGALQKARFAIFRSIKMLVTDIVVLSLSLYSAYTYALTFSYFASTPYVYPRYYGFDMKQTSLTFLGIMIGYFLAIGLFAFFDRTLYAKAREAAEEALPAPEHRLYSALVGSILLPIGLFWYAWAPREGGNWAVLAASGIPFGFGAFSLFLSTITYLVDVYQSGAAASGAVFPLFTLQMYEELGIHWAGSVFAFLSVLLLPIPWLLFRYGDRLRTRSGRRA